MRIFKKKENSIVIKTVNLEEPPCVYEIGFKDGFQSTKTLILALLNNDNFDRERMIKRVQSWKIYQE